jgi:hypothetical protein
VKYALAALLWLGASGAHASDGPEPCAPEVELRSLQLDHRGHPGVWFDARVARCLLEEVKLGRELQGLVDDYARRDVLRGELTDLLERQLDLAVREAEEARHGMETAIQLRGEAERKLTSPGRSRGLWLAVGLVSGVLLTGLSAYTLSVATR